MKIQKKKRENTIHKNNFNQKVNLISQYLISDLQFNNLYTLLQEQRKQLEDVQFQFSISPQRVIRKCLIGGILAISKSLNLNYHSGMKDFKNKYDSSVQKEVRMIKSVFNIQSLDYYRNPKFSDSYVKLDSKYKQQLQVGDLFKFGRLEYFISELNTGDKVLIAEDHYNLHHHIKSGKTQVTRQCKFCLMDDLEQVEDPANPYLTNLCGCLGHMSYVHYQCLKLWINFNKRITCKQTQNIVQCHWNQALECDICKVPLPVRIYIENQEQPFQLIQIEKLDGPYIILEQITRQDNLSKSLIFIHSFGTNMVSIGRGHNSEVRCQDISVSRNYANISFNNDSWWIQDQGSKFGTLRIIPDKLLIDDEVKEIQIGRVLLKMKQI